MISQRKKKMIWRQRSRVEWLQGGDRSTIFFHSKALNQIWRNRMEWMKDNSWHQVFEEKEKIQVVMKYFQDIFSTAGTQNMNEVLDTVEPCINTQTTTKLQKAFTKEEIIDALEGLSLTIPQQPAKFSISLGKEAEEEISFYSKTSLRPKIVSNGLLWKT